MSTLGLVNFQLRTILLTQNRFWKLKNLGNLIEKWHSKGS